jgi:hypothetical protein
VGSSVGILDNFRNDKDINVVVVTGAAARPHLAQISRNSRSSVQAKRRSRATSSWRKSYAAFHEF